jgi:cytochrome c
VDSFEWNKIAGGLLASLLLVMVVGTAAGFMYQSHTPETPAYVPAGCEGDRTCGQGSGGGAAPVKEAEPPFELALQTASAEKGANVFKKCATCHTIEKGGANKTGPNLWGVMGAKHAHIAGFGYSKAMMETASQTWGWKEVYEFTKAPKTYMPGTKMAFAGISKQSERADLLVYLNQNSDSPLPLPAPPAAAPATAEAAPAADGAAKPAEAAAADAAKPAEPAKADAAAAAPAKQ